MLETLADIFTDARVANVIALGALVAALLSLRYTRLIYVRDQPKLKFEAWTYFPEEHPGYVEVKATNIGRQPISLIRLWGRDEHGLGQGQFFSGHLDAGVKLLEHDVKVFRVSHLPREADTFNADAMDGEDDTIIVFKRLWIEDALGQPHEIPHMADMLPALHMHYTDWCRRTQYWAPTKTPPTQTQPAHIPS